MPRCKSAASFALILALAAASAVAAEDQHEQHHPGGSPPAAAAPQGMPAGGMAGMGQGGMPMMGMMRMMEGGMGVPMMEGHVEGRIAFLKTELKITDAQLPLWNPVADAMRASAKGGMGMMAGMGMMQGGKLPERLATREKAMTERLEALRKFKAAVEPLYAALSDEQKKTADEMLMSPVSMM
jgi:hypothetical protein